MLDRLSPLATRRKAGREGADDDAEAGVILSERPGISIVQVAAFPEDAETVAAAIDKALGNPPPGEANRASGDRETAILWIGPERWLVVEAESKREGALAATLERALAALPTVAVTDLGHGRAVLRLAGARLRELLAMGCALDFHAESFAPGHCAQSRFGHIGVLFHAVTADSFDLYVARGFAQHLWEELCDHARGFGLEIR